MRTHWSTLADTLAEVEAVADERGDDCRLLDILADTLAEVEAVTLGDARVDAHALVDTGLHASSGGGGDTRRQKGRCPRTG